MRANAVNGIHLGRVTAMISVSSTETVAQIMNSSAAVQLRVVRANAVNGIHLGRVTVIIFVSSTETVARIINRYVHREI